MRGGLTFLICNLMILNLTYGIKGPCKNGFDWIPTSGECVVTVSPRFHYEAVKVCSWADSRLILPRSQNDAQFIWQMLKAVYGANWVPWPRMWIDVKYENGRWVDHKSNMVVYTPWADPVQVALDIHQGFHCAAMLTSGEWEVHNCAIFLPVMCTYKATTMTTIATTTTAIKTTSPDPCSPNQCENGVCHPVANQRFPNYSFTCICPDRYGGPKCTLIDDPCTKDPTAKCKNNGECKVKEQPGKNDWFCVCPGELKIGQAKDCSGGKSEKTIRYEKRQKSILIATVIVPSWVFGVACAIFCIYECVQIGELPDLDTNMSDSSTSSSSSDSDTEGVLYNLKLFWNRRRNRTKKSSGKDSRRVTFASDIGAGKSVSNSSCVNEQTIYLSAISEGSRRVTFSSITGSVQSGSKSNFANDQNPLADDIAIQLERNEDEDIEKALSLPTTVSSKRKSGTVSSIQEKEERERLDQLFKDRNLRLALLQAKLDRERKNIKKVKSGHALRHGKFISDIFNREKYNISKEKGEPSGKKRNAKRKSPQRDDDDQTTVNSTRKSDANTSIPEKQEKEQPGQLINDRNFRLALLQAKLDRDRADKTEKDRKDAKRSKAGHGSRHGKFISDIFNKDKYSISKDKGESSGKNRNVKRTSPGRARALSINASSSRKSYGNTSSIQEKEDKEQPGRVVNDRNIRLALLQAKLDRDRAEKAERDTVN